MNEKLRTRLSENGRVNGYTEVIGTKESMTLFSVDIFENNFPLKSFKIQFLSIKRVLLDLFRHIFIIYHSLYKLNNWDKWDKKWLKLDMKCPTLLKHFNSITDIHIWPQYIVLCATKSSGNNVTFLKSPPFYIFS